jgi:DNA-binding Xre family transcriptional regulator
MLAMPLEFRLRQVLEDAEISQSDFAKEAKLSFATINRLCTNATGQVSLDTLDKIMMALRKRGASSKLEDIIGPRRSTR